MTSSSFASQSVIGHTLLLGTSVGTGYLGAEISGSTHCAGTTHSCAPIYNAKTEALNYTGGEVSATLQQGIDALDANYDTSKLSREEKIQHISLF